jgi:hypothetical protein
VGRGGNLRAYVRRGEFYKRRGELIRGEPVREEEYLIGRGGVLRANIGRGEFIRG